MTNILDILNREYPIKFDSAGFLREGGCVSYIAASGSERYLVKIVKPAFADTFRQSAEVIQFLNERDFPAPKIVLMERGLPYCQNGTDYLIVFEYLDGDDVDNDSATEQIGELIGQLHSMMSSYSGTLVTHGKDYFIDRYIRLLLQYGISDKTVSAFTEIGGELWERESKLPWGYMHGDCHAGNLMRVSGALYLFDFDTSALAIPSYDVAMMCDATDYFKFNKADCERSKFILSQFMRGYSKHITLSDAETDAFFDLIMLHHFQCQATIIELFGMEGARPELIAGQLDWLRHMREYSSII
jgi:Ser/Thr protein kinase RdoA (MazF antagonist)